MCSPNTAVLLIEPRLRQVQLMIQAVDQDRAVVGDRFNAVVSLELFDESAEFGQMRIQCFESGVADSGRPRP